MLLESETSPAACVPDAPATTPPTQRRVDCPADRIIRQIQGIDSWNASRRTREQVLLRVAGSGEPWGEAARDLEAWRRAHQALLDRAADELGRDPAPMLTPPRTAVLAHSSPHYAELIRGCLDALGITVLSCSINGPDTLGVVIAEQPSVLFVSDGLEMMTGPALLREAARFSPHTVLAAYTVATRQDAAFSAGAHAVFLRQQPADAVSWWLQYVLPEPADDPARESIRQGSARDSG